MNDVVDTVREDIKERSNILSAQREQNDIEKQCNLYNKTLRYLLIGFVVFMGVLLLPWGDNGSIVGVTLILVTCVCVLIVKQVYSENPFFSGKS